MQGSSPAGRANRAADPPSSLRRLSTAHSPLWVQPGLKHLQDMHDRHHMSSGSSSASQGCSSCCCKTGPRFAHGSGSTVVTHVMGHQAGLSAWTALRRAFVRAFLRGVANHAEVPAPSLFVRVCEGAGWPTVRLLLGNSKQHQTYAKQLMSCCWAAFRLRCRLITWLPSCQGNLGAWLLHPVLHQMNRSSQIEQASSCASTVALHLAGCAKCLRTYCAPQQPCQQQITSLLLPAHLAAGQHLVHIHIEA